MSYRDWKPLSGCHKIKIKMHNVTVPTLHYRPLEVGTSKDASKVNFKVLLIKKKINIYFHYP